MDEGCLYKDKERAEDEKKNRADLRLEDEELNLNNMNNGRDRRAEILAMKLEAVTIEERVESEGISEESVMGEIVGYVNDHKWIQSKVGHDI